MSNFIRFVNKSYVLRCILLLLEWNIVVEWNVCCCRIAANLKVNVKCIRCFFQVI